MTMAMVPEVPEVPEVPRMTMALVPQHAYDTSPGPEWAYEKWL